MQEHLQSSYSCRLLWGRRGAKEGAQCGDGVVIVDVLSFSTAVGVGVGQGGFVYPCQNIDEALAVAQRTGAVVARKREAHALDKEHTFSLSPPSLAKITPGQRIALASPNGATCSRLAINGASFVLAGALVNARVVASVAQELAQERGVRLTIVPCGERWSTSDHNESPLRFALEDWWGAGAILTHLEHNRALSPEALACARGSASLQQETAALLRSCASGRELEVRGFAEDVTWAARRDIYTVAPLLDRDHYRAVAPRGERGVSSPTS